MKTTNMNSVSKKGFRNVRHLETIEKAYQFDQLCPKLTDFNHDIKVTDSIWPSKKDSNPQLDDMTPETFWLTIFLYKKIY